MSTNYTKNYKLCQWEPGDKVLRTDFNEDNAKLETALTRIETTADRADAASQAAYNLSYPGFVTGHYSGQAENDSIAWKTITLGFQPRAVLIWPDNHGLINSISGRMYVYGGLILRGGSQNVAATAFYITENGFTVRNTTVTTNGNIYRFPNQSGYTYNYIAFR